MIPKAERLVLARSLANHFAKGARYSFLVILSDPVCPNCGTYLPDETMDFNLSVSGGTRTCATCGGDEPEPITRLEAYCRGVLEFGGTNAKGATG